LKDVKRRNPVFVKRNDLAVDNGVEWQVHDCFRDGRKAAGEIFLIARPELDRAPRSAADRPITIELQLAAPLGTFWWPFDAGAQRRLK
jgi:hypothetical protein